MKRYTRKELEEFLYIQLDNITKLSEQINLLQEQNDLLEKYNVKLKQELLPLKKYPLSKRKKDNHNEK
jgi:5-bromo-4-chloroindolyl phosphate hydrolysis protein